MAVVIMGMTPITEALNAMSGAEPPVEIPPEDVAPERAHGPEGSNPPERDHAPQPQRAVSTHGSAGLGHIIDSAALSSAIGTHPAMDVLDPVASTATAADVEPGAPHGPFSREPSTHARIFIDQTRDHLGRAVSANGLDGVGHLAQARTLLDAALDEAMAQALLDGASLRTVAEQAGVAPNTIPPRLGRTVSLGPYREPDGRVMAAGLSRARLDRRLARLAASLGAEAGFRGPPTRNVEPLRFRRRGM